MSGGTAKGSMIRPLLWAASHTMTATPAATGDADKDRRQPQQHAQLFFPDAQMQMLELFVQVMFLHVDQQSIASPQGPAVCGEMHRLPRGWRHPAPTPPQPDQRQKHRLPQRR